MPGTPQRLDRLLRLIDALQTGERLTARELAEQTGVSPRTVLRDLTDLAKFDVEVIRESDKTYRLSTTPDGPWGLTEDEAILLLSVCRQFGRNLAGSPDFEQLTDIGDKLYQAMSPAVRRRADARSELVTTRQWERAKSDRTQAFYDLLLRAAIARKRLRIRYRSLSDETFCETDLAPYRLLFAKRTWYCIGHSSLHRDVRTFHLGRIATVEELEKTFRIPTSFSLDSYFGNAWRLIRGEPTEQVVLRFRPMVAQNVAEIVWHPTQSLAWEDDGSLRVEFTVDGLGEMSWWVLGYGEQVEVLQPPALRDLVRDHAVRMVGVYDG